MKVQLLAVCVFLLPVLAAAQGGKLLDIKIPEEAAPAAVSTAPAAAKPAKEAAEIKVIKPTAPKAAAAPKVSTAPAAVKPVDAPVAVKPAAAPAAIKPGTLPSGFRPGKLTVLPKEERGAGGFKVLKIHQIEKGDTLWDLAGKYYKDPFMWGRIYNANFSSVANPDRIYPRDELVIPDITELLVPYRQPPAQSREAEEFYPDEAEVYAPPASVRTQAFSVQSAGEMLKDFDAYYLSEEMPEDQTEWSDSVKVVPDDWREDGVVTARLKDEDDFLSEGLSITGEMLEIEMRGPVARPGDYLAIYLRGNDAYDKSGKRAGRKLQPIGLAEVVSAEGRTLKARVIDSTTGIKSGYVVKKK